MQQVTNVKFGPNYQKEIKQLAKNVVLPQFMTSMLIMLSNFYHHQQILIKQVKLLIHQSNTLKWNSEWASNLTIQKQLKCHSIMMSINLLKNKTQLQINQRDLTIWFKGQMHLHSCHQSQCLFKMLFKVSLLLYHLLSSLSSYQLVTLLLLSYLLYVLHSLLSVLWLCSC